MFKHIDANYSAIYGPVWFIFGMLVHLHALHILLTFHENILKSFELLIFSYYRWAASSTACHALQGDRWKSPRLGLPACEDNQTPVNHSC